MAVTFETRAGDNAVTVELTLIQKNGQLQPLDGTETCTFTFSDWTGTPVITKAGSVSSQTESKMSVSVGSTDTAGKGGMVLRGKCEVFFSTGGSETFPTVPDDLVLALYP